ncbi:MAG TPA: alpha-glucan family phosphorylase [Gemmatimonadales bacterium]|nr:alpha-glucan family phosphorylase [Gemmatimonadales bacterium]
MMDGTRDIARGVSRLRARLPAPLAPLASVAYNYRWAWSAEGADLFRRMDPAGWERSGENPVHFLREAVDSVEQAAEDGRVVAAAGRLAAEIEQDLARPWSEHGPPPAEPIAFFCAEYGVQASLPIYAGGMGVLAGDYLKQASDSAVPLVGVGLLYRQGYFHQRVDASGWQHEHWIETTGEVLPCERVTTDGRALVVEAPVEGRRVRAYVWRADVGRIPLYLLDSDHPDNDRIDRWITARLYVGDRRLRLAQYLLLGIGGLRALRAMGIAPGVLHLNEGHTAFAALELAREAAEQGVPWDEALAHARSRCVFTTHTPVASGNDVYSTGDVRQALAGFLASPGVDAASVLALGRPQGNVDTGEFGVTPLALRLSRTANGVSRRHGRMARATWHGLYPDRAVDAVPIGHVTNGVHLPTWMAPAMRDLLGRYLGAGWESRAAEPATWDAVDRIPDEELWAVRQALRSDLVEYVRDRSAADRLDRGDSIEYARAASDTFDAGRLTVGFARRLATYKRLYLLTFDRSRALGLLQGERPLQLLIAGKAHPQDEEAKRVVQQQLFPMRSADVIGRRVCFLDDYDLSMAIELVRGCDVWLNLPRPPQEASGTSGMKAALNGGLNLSVLDGWWEEAFDGSNGWGIGGDVAPDQAAQDARDAGALYDLLEREVVPLFYERDKQGIPRGWVRRIKQSLRTIGPRYSSQRMLEDYVATAYRAGEPAGVSSGAAAPPGFPA